MKHCIKLLMLFSVLLFISCSFLDDEYKYVDDYWVDSFNFKEGETYRISDPILLNSGNYTIPQNCTLQFVDSSWRLQLWGGSHLTIEEGAVIEMRDYFSFSLCYGKCKLTVNGTADNPVIFRNIDTTSQIGWAGISISEYADGSYLDIRHAVIDGAVIGIECEKETGGLILENSVIKNSKKYGVKLKTSCASHIDSSLFQNNGEADIYSEGTNFSNIKLSNKFETGISLYNATEYDWVLPQCSYIITDILTLRGSSVISEGTVLRFKVGQSLYSFLKIVDGSLDINGTAKSPVVLTTGGSYTWDGLLFLGNEGDQNKYQSVLNYTIIDYAVGSITWDPIYLRHTSLHLSNSTIRNYGHKAVTLDSTSFFINDNNTGFDSTNIIIRPF